MMGELIVMYCNAEATSLATKVVYMVLCRKNGQNSYSFAHNFDALGS
jgi:hypothetical protein